MRTTWRFVVDDDKVSRFVRAPAAASVKLAWKHAGGIHAILS